MTRNQFNPEWATDSLHVFFLYYTFGAFFAGAYFLGGIVYPPRPFSLTPDEFVIFFFVVAIGWVFLRELRNSTERP